jgi:hypothetical protein
MKVLGLQIEHKNIRQQSIERAGDSCYRLGRNIRSVDVSGRPMLQLMYHFLHFLFS